MQSADDEADRVYGTVGPTVSDGCSAVGSHNVVEVRVVHLGSMGCSSLAMPKQMMRTTRHSDVHDHVGEPFVVQA